MLPSAKLLRPTNGAGLFLFFVSISDYILRMPLQSWRRQSLVVRLARKQDKIHICLRCISIFLKEACPAWTRFRSTLIMLSLWKAIWTSSKDDRTLRSTPPDNSLESAYPSFPGYIHKINVAFKSYSVNLKYPHTKSCIKLYLKNLCFPAYFVWYSMY